jgi:hypothetical protein
MNPRTQVAIGQLRDRIGDGDGAIVWRVIRHLGIYYLPMIELPGAYHLLSSAQTKIQDVVMDALEALAIDVD